MKKTPLPCLAILSILILNACDSSPDKDRQIDITPSSIELTGRGATALFEAAIPVLPTDAELLPGRELLFPLRWSVSQPVLGRIVSTEGVRAVYESTGLQGNQVIIVLDQADREGLASITQVIPVVTNAVPVQVTTNNVPRLLP